MTSNRRDASHDIELFNYDDEDKTLPTHSLDDLAREDDPPVGGTTTATTRTSHHTTENKKHATAYLDGLRGLAALFVYIYHHISWFYGPTDDLINGFGAGGNYYFFQLPFVRLLLTGGNAGVVIFFVLSGYVLSISPLRTLKDGNLKKCYRGLVSSVVRRPVRLYIPPIGVTFIFAIALHLPFGLAPKLGWPAPQASLVQELRKWVGETIRALTPSSLMPDVLAPWFPYDPPVYTIPVELLGSGLVFGMLAVSARLSSKSKAIFLGVSGLGLLIIYQWAMACFLLGMLLALNDVGSAELKPTRLHLTETGRTIIHHACFFVGWYLLGQTVGDRNLQISLDNPGWYLLTKLTPSTYSDADWKEYWRWWHTWGAFMLTYSVLRITWLQRFFSSPPLKYLGKISFSLYLVHGPLMWTLGDRIYRFFGHITQPDMHTMFDEAFVVPDFGVHGVTARFLISQVFILPMTFCFAHVGTRLLDEPSVRFGRWITTKLKIDSVRK